MKISVLRYMLLALAFLVPITAAGIGLQPLYIFLLTPLGFVWVAWAWPLGLVRFLKESAIGAVLALALAGLLALALLDGEARLYSLMYLAILTPYSVVGCLVGFFLSHILRRWVPGKNIQLGLLVLLTLATCITSGMSLWHRKQAKQEAGKRSQFFRALAQAVAEGKVSTVNNEDIIRAGIPTGIYEHSATTIQHDLGGPLTVKREGDTIHVLFEKIPQRHCFPSYFMNSPAMFGFKRTQVNGQEVIPQNTADAIEAEKVHLCGREHFVSIRFSGTVDEIKLAPKNVF